MSYLFGMPPVVLYGADSVKMLGAQINKLNVKKALIVADSFLEKNGAVKKLGELLLESEIEYEVYAGVDSEPKDYHIDDGLKIYKNSQCDSVIAYGGGSSIDVAKGIAVMGANPGKILDYEGRDKIKEKRVPLVAITTTAGTGSELSKADIITESATHNKKLIKDNNLRPDIAVCDPVLTASMPQPITAASGFDALAHAIEGYCSNEAQPLTDILALEAIKIISSNLTKAWSNGNDMEARAAMMLGALLAGIVISSSSTASAHGLARPFGGHFGMSHGVSVALFLPEVMEFNLPACPEKYRDIAVAMGEDVGGFNLYEAGMKAVQAVRRIRQAIKLPTVYDLNIDKEECLGLIEKMVEEGGASHTLNPRIPTKDELIQLYKSIWK